MPTKFTESQFWSLVDKTGSCWLWLGKRNPAGYGVVTPTLAGSRYAHRAAYTLTRGPVPQGMDLDHICHSADSCKGRCQHRRCVNPAHLEPVTHYVNMRRGKQANQTHCKHGHELAGENLIIRQRANGIHTYRQCRACLQIRARKSA